MLPRVHFHGVILRNRPCMKLSGTGTRGNSWFNTPCGMPGPCCPGGPRDTTIDSGLTIDQWLIRGWRTPSRERVMAEPIPDIERIRGQRSTLRGTFRFSGRGVTEYSGVCIEAGRDVWIVPRCSVGHALPTSVLSPSRDTINGTPWRWLQANVYSSSAVPARNLPRAASGISGRPA